MFLSHGILLYLTLITGDQETPAAAAANQETAAKAVLTYCGRRGTTHFLVGHDIWRQIDQHPGLSKV